VRYVDSSVLVSAVTSERETLVAQTFLGTAEGGPLVVTPWSLTEVAAALSMKLRMRLLKPKERLAAQDNFDATVSESLTVVPIGPRAFELAERLCRRGATALRAGDALHLAVAEQIGATLHTFDKGLARAAESLGVSAALVR